MRILPPTVDLFPVTNNKKSITAAANTICLSFSRDPLIQWLQPGGHAWEHLDYRTCRWQYRRIQRALYQGIVLQSACVHSVRRKYTEYSVSSRAVGQENEYHDSGAVVILFPPKKQLKWTLQRFLLGCRVWFLDWIDPVSDSDADSFRLEKLMTAHELGLKLIQNQYSNSEVWYLEVIGIHPLLQSCGLGRRVMEQVFEYVGDQCIALECTNERNIGFYEKLGFRIVQEVQLDGDRKSSPDTVDTVKYWLMVRNDSRG